MENLSAYQNIQQVQGPSFQGTRRVQEQAYVSKPEQIKDGDKKLRNALVGLGAIALGGVLLYKNKGKVGDLAHGVTDKAKDVFKGGKKMQDVVASAADSQEATILKGLKKGEAKEAFLNRMGEFSNSEGALEKANKELQELQDKLAKQQKYADTWGAVKTNHLQNNPKGLNATQLTERANKCDSKIKTAQTEIEKLTEQIEKAKNGVAAAETVHNKSQQRLLDIRTYGKEVGDFETNFNNAFSEWQKQNKKGTKGEFITVVQNGTESIKDLLEAAKQRVLNQ